MQWGKLNQVKSNGISQDIMANYIVTDFTSAAQPAYLDVEKELPSKLDNEKHLRHLVKEILKLLKDIFFKEEKLLVESLDKLLSLCETALQTHFGVSIHTQEDENAAFLITDSLPQGSSILIRVQTFLSNVREIICILSNLLHNQIKIIVNTRVQYSKEDFQFESYLSLAMHDDRLVRNAVFCKSGKFLVADYFRFQKNQKDLFLTEFDMKTYNDVAILIVKLVTHMRPLARIQFQYDLEPLFCKLLLTS